MSRTLHISHPAGMLRAAGFALAAAALVATGACKPKEEPNGGRPVAGPVSTPVVTTTDSSGGVTGGTTGADTVVDVSFDEAEKAYRERRYEEAVGLFTGYVTSKPGNPWGHYMLGLSAWKSGDLSLARGALERSLELDPRHVKTLLNLSRVLLELGDAKEALRHVTAAIKVDEGSAEAYRLMGRVRTAFNMPNEALAAYQIALSHDPTDVWSMNNMGLLLVQQQRYEEALRPLARAVQLDSTVPVFHNNLGIALEHTGHYVLATQEYRAAVTLDSSYTRAVLSLSRVNGRKEDPTLVPVELSVLAEAFDREVRTVQLGNVKPPR
jgi:tetratricopeptide (TPR) repeat protein